VRHIAHRIARHSGKLIIAACCAGAIGPGGGALSAAPENAPHAAYAAPLPASAGWPDMPGWSVASGAAFGNAPVLIPVYERAPSPQLLDTRPVVFPRKPPTNVPEPSSVAVFLLPGLWVLWVRRRMRA
jgi:hypothetical protein